MYKIIRKTTELRFTHNNTLIELVNKEGYSKDNGNGKCNMGRIWRSSEYVIYRDGKSLMGVSFDKYGNIKEQLIQMIEML